MPLLVLKLVTSRIRKAPFLVRPVIDGGERFDVMFATS